LGAAEPLSCDFGRKPGALPPIIAHARAAGTFGHELARDMKVADSPIPKRIAGI
jgi:hypothetical protein